jgi:hypothetical protein
MFEVGRLCLTHLLIPGVNAAREPLLVCNLLEQLRQLSSIGGAKCGEERILMLSGHLTNSLQGFAPSLGQMERIQPPVVGVWLPLDKLPLFEIVQDGHQTAGMDAQLFRKLLLADRRHDAQQPKDPRIGWGKLQRS